MDGRTLGTNATAEGHQFRAAATGRGSLAPESTGLVRMGLASSADGGILLVSGVAARLRETDLRGGTQAPLHAGRAWFVRLSRGAQRLLDLLRWYGSRFQRIFPFQSKLAAHLGVCVRQLRRYINELVNELLVRVRRAGPHAAEYELAPEALADKNVRSLSGHCPVTARSSFITVSAPQTARVERKPPRSEDERFDRALEKLLAQGYKA